MSQSRTHCAKNQYFRAAKVHRNLRPRGILQGCTGALIEVPGPVVSHRTDFMS